ncbi:MAG: YadA-like family protein, partial [Megasphaera micronuciformis]|nr:YadA-like family protein [Megasphaera micronuciformis]
FNNASFGVVNGAYSAITGKDYSKNFGATITGSLNSIESETVANNNAGVANSIVGLANRTHNTNGSLIFGAGNEITNSIGSLSAPAGGAPSPKDLADTLRTAVQNAGGGGSTLAMGMGNKADYTLGSQLSGVNNTLKGTSAASVSKYNLLNGYKNTGTDVNHVSVVGSENTISNTDNAIVMGDKRTLTNANGSIILGSGNSALTTSVGNAVSVGYNANVLQAGGVAIGANSVASVAAGAVGYDPHTGGVSSNSSSTWKATDAAVSVGNGTTVTRQITGVAAGTNDTDAVNVAQLKRVIAGTTIVDNTLVNRLGNRVNRVGAGAAALAALHPLAFDPDYKWDFAAGYGNYAGANAMAVGAYYRPNEDIMFSMGGSFGGGENMMNAGVSFKLGQGTHVKRSASELSKEVEELKAIVKAQSEEIQALRANQEALAQAVAIQK